MIEYFTKLGEATCKTAVKRATKSARKVKAVNRQNHVRRQATHKANSAKAKNDLKHEGGGCGNYGLALDLPKATKSAKVAGAAGAKPPSKGVQAALRTDFDAGVSGLWQCSICKKVWKAQGHCKKHTDGNLKDKSCTESGAIAQESSKQ